MSAVLKNENKLAFKGFFLQLMKEAEPGAFITDAKLLELCADKSLRLSIQDIQGCIRQLESIIGATYKIRAVRIYKEGYKIFVGEDQYHKATDEGRTKVVKTLKKTSKRIEAVDLEKLPPGVKMNAISNKMAIDSLLSIAKGVMASRNLEVKDVNVLSSAVNELKAIEQLKGKY